MIDFQTPGLLCAHGETPSSPKSSPSPDALSGDLLDTPILIIEDEAMIAWMVQGLFEDMGFTAITIAADGRDALAAASRLPPGLIVSDVNLGGGPDGVDTTAAIRTLCPCPVLFVTGYAGPEIRGRIERDIPHAAILRKPIEPEALRLAVIEALRPTIAQ